MAESVQGLGGTSAGPYEQNAFDEFTAVIGLGPVTTSRQRDPGHDVRQGRLRPQVGQLWQDSFDYTAGFMPKSTPAV
jgi:hypothetical protein